MKYVELKVTEYQIFEIDDDVTYDDLEDMLVDGYFVMDDPDISYVDAQIVKDKKDLDGSYEQILFK